MGLKMFDGDNASSLAGGRFNNEKNKKDVFVDDSFMIQGPSVGKDKSDSQLRIGIGMVPEIEATLIRKWQFRKCTEGCFYFL